MPTTLNTTNPNHAGDLNMNKYTVTNLETGNKIDMSLEQAAAVTGLDASEIEWACEEYGYCETDKYSVTPAES